MNDTNYLKKLRFYLLAIPILLFSFSHLNAQKLFEKNSEDWIIKGDANWKLKNNKFIGSVADGSGFVITKQNYKDFVLEVEFKPDNTINSGVFIRCKNYEIGADDCHEINIWDTHPNQDFRTGSIVKKAIPLEVIETNNKWNTYKIKSKNNHIQVWLNGILTADIKDSTLIEGHIGLQAMGTGKIKFRNATVTAL